MDNQTTQVVTTQTQELDSYNISKPSSLVSLAKTMQKYIEEQGLFSMIQGKKFPNVEAWQFAGMSLGIIPVLESVTNLSNDKEIKYESTVRLERTESGQVVGRGTSVCSNQEKTKKYFEEYAIQSMSETRAVGKAYRMMLSFLMKSAGFEATPAEEMAGLEPTPEEKKLTAICSLLKVQSRGEYVVALKRGMISYGDDSDYMKAAEYVAMKFPKPAKEVPTEPAPAQ